MTRWRCPNKTTEKLIATFPRYNDGKYPTRSNVHGRHQKNLHARKSQLKAQADKNAATHLAAAHAKNKQKQKSMMKTKKPTFSCNRRGFSCQHKLHCAPPSPHKAWGLFYDSQDDSSSAESSHVSNPTDNDSLYGDLNKSVDKKLPDGCWI